MFIMYVRISPGKRSLRHHHLKHPNDAVEFHHWPLDPPTILLRAWIRIQGGLRILDFDTWWFCSKPFYARIDDYRKPYRGGTLFLKVSARRQTSVAPRLPEVRAV
ncbi:hypothetical protein NE237_006253 [Protea cynaroides]|uniref:Uncharacterized protein n=1 Tax=Protea cynaroides TaxID=273540 RepID=A0A9Q0QVC9_9MAGN|nr:hypothetical protein NE237_006253 [Protea cynaroides]